jgi:DNA-directed RNA polymerase specialized sigma24 family protein
VNINAPEVELEPRSDGPNPEQSASTEEFRRAVRREILKLSPKLRDALLLAQSGEYGYEEVSAMLNTPIGTIKWRVSEARRKDGECRDWRRLQRLCACERLLGEP